MLIALYFLWLNIATHQCPISGIDYSSNYVANGNFQTPSIGASPVLYPGGFPPWTTALAQIGVGTNYNSNWGSTQVAALDSGLNQAYTQTFNIPTAGTFFFSISFAKRQGFSPSTSGLRIYWNGRNVAQQPTSSDDLIHSITLNLTSNSGTNTIIIQAMGHDDGEGTTIDDVGVYPIIDYHRALINGVCSCGVGYFDNGYNIECVPCSDMDPNCAQCTFAPNASLLTASCLSNITSGVNCAFGTFTCTVCGSGYFLDQVRWCSPIQIIPNFYQPNWQLKYIKCNKFSGKIQITIPMFLSVFDVTTNNSNVSVTQFFLSPTSTPDVYEINLQADYFGNIADQIITFKVQFYNTSNLIDTVATIIDMKASNTPLVLYTEQQCGAVEQFADFSIALAVTSYIIMFFSLISLKIVGLQLFGVLQLAFFSLASHDRVDIYLQPLLKWKYINGFNVQVSNEIRAVSNTIGLMSYKDNFFYNFNFMFAVLTVNLIVGGILYFIGNFKKIQKVYKISLYTLKQVFITLFLFNSLNIAFSIGLHCKYANPLTTQLYELSVVGVLCGFCLFIFAASYMQIVKQKQFGEYKDKFKVNCVNKFYIPLSIIYRFILGFYIAMENQWYLSTLVIIGANIAFIMFNIINLPFKRAYQNYRANFCHLCQLVILLVSNYYRSMKSNTPMDERGKIHGPAIFQLVVICLCVVISFFCLLYEIITLIKDHLANRKTKDKVDESEAKLNINSFHQIPGVDGINKIHSTEQCITNQS